MTTHKRITFHQSVKVILIPTRNEYKAASLLKDLWWDDSDYREFKTSTIKEIKSVMMRDFVDSRTACDILNQYKMNCLNDSLTTNNTENFRSNGLELIPYQDPNTRSLTLSSMNASSLSNKNQSCVNTPPIHDLDIGNVS